MDQFSTCSSIASQTVSPLEATEANMGSLQSESQEQSVSPSSQTIEQPAKRKKKTKETNTEEDDDGDDTFITDPNKRRARFYTYRERMENYLYHLSRRTGAYGFLYLRPYVISYIVHDLLEQG